MVLEIITNILLSMVMFIRGNPTDEKVNQNIELLKETEWFKQIYSKNEELFKKNEDLRYIVGHANVKKSLRSQKRADKLRMEILDAMDPRL